MSERLLFRAAVGTLIAALASLFLPTALASADHQIPYHWSRFTPQVTAKSQAYLEDYTGTRWPVTLAVYDWDNQSRVLVYYKSGGTCNHSTLHCIPVREGNYGNTGWYGRTVYTVGASNHINQNSAYVQLNNSYSTTANMRRSIACHELGHAIGGQTESSRTDSCMYGFSDRFPLHPSAHDFAVLANVYNGHAGG